MEKQQKFVIKEKTFSSCFSLPNMEDIVNKTLLYFLFRFTLPNIAIVIPVPIKIVPIVTARQACHKHEVVTRPSIRKL